MWRKGYEEAEEKYYLWLQKKLYGVDIQSKPADSTDMVLCHQHPTVEAEDVEGEPAVEIAPAALQIEESSAGSDRALRKRLEDLEETVVFLVEELGRVLKRVSQLEDVSSDPCASGVSINNRKLPRSDADANATAVLREILKTHAETRNAAPVAQLPLILNGIQTILKRLDDLQEDSPAPENYGSPSTSKGAPSVGLANNKQRTAPQPKNETGLTDVVALDCEMVASSPRREDDMLARVSIVNMYGKVVLDVYVQPTRPVTDYRTPITGIKPEHLKKGTPLPKVRKMVSDIFRGRIVVGHGLHHDFGTLAISHANRMKRDTSTYEPYVNLFKGKKTPALKDLAHRVLALKIQEGQHSSVVDAQTAMKLYLYQRNQWEQEFAERAEPNGRWWQKNKKVASPKKR